MYCANSGSKNYFGKILMVCAFVIVSALIFSTYAFPQQLSIAPVLMTDTVLDTKTTRFSWEWKAVCTPRVGTFGMYQARLNNDGNKMGQSPIEWQRIELGINPAIALPSLGLTTSPMANLFVFYARDMLNGSEIKGITPNGNGNVSSTTSTNPITLTTPSSFYNGAGVRLINRSGRNVLDMSATIFDRNSYSAEIKYGWMGREIFCTLGLRQQRYGVVIPPVYGTDGGVLLAEQSVGRTVLSTMFEIGAIF